MTRVCMRIILSTLRVRERRNESRGACRVLPRTVLHPPLSPDSPAAPSAPPRVPAPARFECSPCSHPPRDPAPAAGAAAVSTLHAPSYPRPVFVPDPDRVTFPSLVSPVTPPSASISPPASFARARVPGPRPKHPVGVVRSARRDGVFAEPRVVFATTPQHPVRVRRRRLRREDARRTGDESDPDLGSDSDSVPSPVGVSSESTPFSDGVSTSLRVSSAPFSDGVSASLRVSSSKFGTVESPVTSANCAAAKTTTSAASARDTASSLGVDATRDKIAAKASERRSVAVVAAAERRSPRDSPRDDSDEAVEGEEEEGIEEASSDSSSDSASASGVDGSFASSRAAGRTSMRLRNTPRRTSSTTPKFVVVARVVFRSFRGPTVARVRGGGFVVESRE